ncbi:hypothetical protein niasHT_023387 [Heterodera trifolii]|uniref:Uncharacterized protein n=1 Tax=Heterodera trifolii TaxID=157864 RepID=A0ABD2K407_9BILA
MCSPLANLWGRIICLEFCCDQFLNSFDDGRNAKMQTKSGQKQQRNGQGKRQHNFCQPPPPSAAESGPNAAEWCKQKKQLIGTANVVQLLRQREQGNRREGSHFVRGGREFYFALSMRRAQLVVCRPQFFPLRFTPSGHQLIAIGANQQEVQLFIYRGFQYGANKSGEALFNAVFPRCQTVQFRHIASPATAAAAATEQRPPPPLAVHPPLGGPLSRECALCTPDSRFLVVSASVPVPESKANFRTILRNNESLSPSKEMADITFYCIDLNKAQLVDQCKFECDQIAVPGGVYLADWTLAILSAQHQTVHMVGIDRHSGHFVPLMQIGHSVLADDQLITGAAQLISARTERCFTAFRQRFLTFLYKEFQRKGQVQQFLHHFDLFRHIKMRKLQFVGPELLLIRMEQPKGDDDFDDHQFASSSFCPPSSSSSYSSSFAAANHQHNHHNYQHMFVLFEWRVGRIVGVFNRSSEALFGAFERHNEQFRNGHIVRTMFPTSMEHCGAERAQHEALKQSSLLTVPASDVRRRFLAALPYPNTQYLLTSPYLDPNMLFSRRTKCLHTRLDFRISAIRTLSYARVLFHPVDPFVISVHKGIQPETLISFHTPKNAAVRSLLPAGRRNNSPI